MGVHSEAQLDKKFIDFDADNFWDGKPTAENIAGYPWNLTHIFDLDTKARYWRVELSDATNTHGFVQIGRLFIGRMFQPIKQYSWGAKIKYETTTEVEVNKRSGIEFFNPSPGYRVVNLSLPQSEENEAMATILDMQRTLGTHNELYFIWNPEDLEHKTRRSFIGRMRALSDLEHDFFGNFTTGFEIKELI